MFLEIGFAKKDLWFATMSAFSWSFCHRLVSPSKNRAYSLFRRRAWEGVIICFQRESSVGVKNVVATTEIWQALILFHTSASSHCNVSNKSNSTYRVKKSTYTALSHHKNNLLFLKGYIHQFLFFLLGIVVEKNWMNFLKKNTRCGWVRLISEVTFSHERNSRNSFANGGFRESQAYFREANAGIVTADGYFAQLLVASQPRVAANDLGTLSSCFSSIESCAWILSRWTQFFHYERPLPTSRDK